MNFGRSMKESDVNMDPKAQIVCLIAICKSMISDLSSRLERILSLRIEGRQSIRKVMSHTKQALYPFRASTIHQLRENVSKINEILQRAAKLGIPCLVPLQYIVEFAYDLTSTKASHFILKL